MRCARVAVAALVLAGAARAGGINTDSALTVGKGQLVSRTLARIEHLRGDVERYVAQQTFAYGWTRKFSVLATLKHTWIDAPSGMPDGAGLNDLSLRGRYSFFRRAEKRGTLGIAGILGAEIPIGEEPFGSPDGGLLAGFVATWEHKGDRLDVDFVNSFRPNAADARRIDVAYSRIVHEWDRGLIFGVLELNYRRTGANDVLFVAPGFLYEIVGLRIDVSFQIRVAEDARGTIPNGAFVLGFKTVF